MDGNENLKVAKATADNVPREKDQEIGVTGGLPLPRLYTVSEVAKYLRLSRSQVYAMISEKRAAHHPGQRTAHCGVRDRFGGLDPETQSL